MSHFSFLIDYNYFYLMKKQFFVKIEGISYTARKGREYDSICFKIKEADRIIVCDLHESQAGYGLLMACGCTKKDVKYRCHPASGVESVDKHFYKNMHHLSLGAIGSILSHYSEIGYIIEPNIQPTRLLVEEVIGGKRICLCDLDLEYFDDVDGFDSLDHEVILRSKRQKGDFDYFFKNKSS